MTNDTPEPTPRYERFTVTYPASGATLHPRASLRGAAAIGSKISPGG